MTRAVRPYMVHVDADCTYERERLDVMVVAVSKTHAEVVAWAFDDHYEIVRGHTCRVGWPDDEEDRRTIGVRAVLPCDVPAAHA